VSVWCFLGFLIKDESDHPKFAIFNGKKQMKILDKIKNSIIKLTKKRPQFNPASLNDEVALRTKWIPAKSGGTNICTHF
jgi:hypothetical protein